MGAVERRFAFQAHRARRNHHHYSLEQIENTEQVVQEAPASGILLTTKSSTPRLQPRGEMMPALVTSKEVERVLRRVLSAQGYSLSAARGIGETGTDVIASRRDGAVHIETISFKSSPPARAKDFYEVFFRAVSRLNNGATRCVIALPARFGMGLHQRAAAIGVAWRRIGDAFPDLEIWLINTEDGTYQETKWNDWG